MPETTEKILVRQRIGSGMLASRPAVGFFTNRDKGKMMNAGKEAYRKLDEKHGPITLTIDQAIAASTKEVGKRIKQLRAERDMLHALARRALSDAAWEKSDMKKWADEQQTDPDND